MKQPETFEQCFEILDSKLNDEQKLEIIKNPISVHHSVGRWIRNNFGFWTKTNKILIEKLKFSSGSLHPDDWSHKLLIDYASYLKNKKTGRKIGRVESFVNSILKFFEIIE